jgi:nucleotide-binding universal stress UspA family protein
MSPVRRFVVGLDDSDEARAALRWAVDHAAVWDAELDVVHAWEMPFTIVPPPINLAYQREVEGLERAAATLVAKEVDAAIGSGTRGPGRIESMPVRGSPAKVLLEVADGADLLVVGNRGRGGFSGLLLGSVSTQCVHHATCPVAVVRGHLADPADHERRPIVVGVDGSECGYQAVKWALADAAQRHAPVVAVAAWSWLGQTGDFDPAFGASDVCAMVDAVVTRARDDVAGGDAVQVEIRPVNDHPGQALVEASRGADRLVVGSRGLGGFRGLLLGSVSNNCIHHAHCPVVVVRH